MAAEFLVCEGSAGHGAADAGVRRRAARRVDKATLEQIFRT